MIRGTQVCISFEKLDLNLRFYPNSILNTFPLRNLSKDIILGHCKFALKEV